MFRGILPAGEPVIIDARHDLCVDVDRALESPELREPLLREFRRNLNAAVPARLGLPENVFAS
jgi:hypothetical protein